MMYFKNYGKVKTFESLYRTVTNFEKENLNIKIKNKNGFSLKDTFF